VRVFVDQFQDAHVDGKHCHDSVTTFRQPNRRADAPQIQLLHLGQGREQTAYSRSSTHGLPQFYGLQCRIELPVIAASSVQPIECDDHIRFNRAALKSCASPCVISPRWERQAKAVSNFHRSRRQWPSGRVFTNNRRELIFLRKNCDHLCSAGRIAIYEQEDVAVVRLRT
jgi:hypothetical protein